MTSTNVESFPINVMELVVKMVVSFESLFVRNVVCDVNFPRVSNLTVVVSKGAAVTSVDVLSFPIDDMALETKMVGSIESLVAMNVVFDVDFPRI